MKLERPEFFSDKIYREEMIYGKEGRYRHPRLDFWTDVYPNVLKAHFDTKQPDKKYKDILTDPFSYPLTVEMILRLCAYPFVAFCTSCFETKLRPFVGDNSDLDPKDFEFKSGMLGLIANLKAEELATVQTLLYVFKTLGDGPIKLSKYLPTCLYNDFIKEVKTPFYMLAEATGIEGFKTEIDKLKFIPHQHPVKIKKPKNYRLIPIEHCHTAIVFEHTEFDKEDQDFFWDMLCFPESYYTLEGVYLNDCRFTAPYVCPYIVCNGKAYFENCVFDYIFAPPGHFKHAWTFKGCVIKKEFDFRHSQFDKGISFYNCVFQKGSYFLLNDSTFRLDNDFRKIATSFDIFYTVFYGMASFKNINMGITPFRMAYVAFSDSFYFDGTNFGKKANLFDISLPATKTPKVEVSKKILSDLLIQQGYKSISESLGLSADSENKVSELNTEKFEHSYKMGWLNPTQAALFISRSKSWLAKKRRTDAQKPNKMSIPFIGQRKAILYPTKALDAFRLQDWNLLKSLCQKYGFGQLKTTDIKDEKLSEHLTTFAKPRTK